MPICGRPSVECFHSVLDGALISISAVGFPAATHLAPSAPAGAPSTRVVPQCPVDQSARGWVPGDLAGPSQTWLVSDVPVLSGYPQKGLCEREHRYGCGFVATRDQAAALSMLADGLSPTQPLGLGTGLGRKGQKPLQSRLAAWTAVVHFIPSNERVERDSADPEDD